MTIALHWFCKPKPEFRTHHIHLVPFGRELWQERVKFRDALRASESLAGEYAMIKRGLAALILQIGKRILRAKGLLSGVFLTGSTANKAKQHQLLRSLDSLALAPFVHGFAIVAQNLQS